MDWPLPSGGVMVILIAVGVRRVRHNRRVLAARATPGAGAPAADRDDLRRRLEALCGPESPFQLTAQGERLTVAWQLHGIPWATLLFRRKLRETQALDLTPGADGTVLVGYRSGRVEWETAAATWMPRANVRWRSPRLFDAGPPHDPADRPPAPTAESPRTFPELVRHVRPVVLAAGFSFQPLRRAPD